MSGYSIASLVTDLKSIAAQHHDDREIVKRVMPLAERMAVDKGWVKADFYEGDDEQGFGVTVLHEEPDHTLLIETIAWLPGRGVKPHDHQTWGVVVGLDGREKNINWRRHDDGSKPGHADIDVNHEVVVGPGEVIAFMPDDIHSVLNEGEKTTLSLHIYGKSLIHVARSEFDPEAKTIRPCPKRSRKRAD